MKILAVAFCPPSGAVPDLFIGIVSELFSQQDAQLFVLCPEHLAVDDKRTFKTYRIAYDKSNLRSLVSKDSSDILNEIISENFDVVFFFTQHILNLPLSILLRTTKQVMWWHEPLKKGRTTFFKHLLYIPHDYQLTKQCSKIIVACKAMEETVPKHLRYKLEFISLPPSFLTVKSSEQIIDIRFNPVNDFLFFGNIERYKGLDILAKALIHLCEQGYSPKLKVIGKGDISNLFPELAKFAQTNPQNVDIVNTFASEVEIITALRSSLAVVLPYLTASGTTTVHIASQQYCPVIATSVGCFQNYIIDGKTGWLVPANDFLSLAETLKKVLDNKENVRTIGKNAHENFMLNYTETMISNKIMKSFKEVSY
jgi:glycosyltransferase involved in cell wall biosynthesis